MMLGKALARYVQHPDAELQGQVYNDAKNFLQQQFENCAIQQGSK